MLISKRDLMKAVDDLHSQFSKDAVTNFATLLQTQFKIFVPDEGMALEDFPYLLRELNRVSDNKILDYWAYAVTNNVNKYDLQHSDESGNVLLAAISNNLQLLTNVLIYNDVGTNSTFV